ncbi:sugar phosphate isomerase/epimerase family protein [Sphingomonas jejuensis]
MHQLTALDAPPRMLTDAAAALGCAGVCLFTHVPDAARGKFPAVTHDDVQPLRSALAAAGMVVANVEVFPLDGAPIEGFATGLDLAALLGAVRATAHVHGASGQEAIDRFAAFARLCRTHGIVAGLEFNRFSAVPDLPTAAAIVRAVRPEPADMVLDLLHLVRSGGTPAEVAAAADLVSYAQVSDGPAAIDDGGRWHEAVSERMLPGEGAFPISRLLSPLRSGTIISVEVPRKSARLAGAGPVDRIGAAVAATRAILHAGGPPR